PARRLDRRGIGLRLAGAGLPRLPGALRARLQPAPRDLLPLGLAGRRGESRRGSALYVPRPPHPRVGVMPGFWRRLLGNRSALIGLVILAVVGVTAAAAPVLFPGSPFRRVDRPFQPPFGAHLFGTDVLGRNVAAGLAHGARTSLMIGILAPTGGGLARPPVGAHPRY